MALYVKRIIAVFVVLCTAALNYVEPDTPKGDPTKGIHIQYGNMACQEYYYYLPTNLRGVKNIVFMVHGGSWSTGDCSQFAEHAVAAAKQGYIAVSMDYRKLQQGANAYDMVKDIYLAVFSLKKQLAAQNIKIGKIALAGWSAGAHLSLLYAYEYYFNASPIPVAFLCVNAPPTDFLYDARSSKTLMGQMAYTLMTGLSGEVILPGTEGSHMKAIKAISPIYTVKSGVPPTIVVNGDDDDVVPPQNSAALYEKLQEYGIDSRHIVYKGAGHFLGSQFAEEKQRARAFNEFAKKYF